MKYLFIISILISQLFAISAISTKGSFSVNKGSATYIINIKKPKLKGTLVFNLSLNYSSLNESSGSLGRSFSIGGLSSIKECKKPALFGGGNITGYCLDGQVLEGGRVDFLSRNGEYKLFKKNHALKINKVNNKWFIKNKNGLTSVYTGSGTKAKIFRLTQIIDINNNIIIYKYDNGKVNTINFSNTSIDFDYTSNKLNNINVRKDGILFSKYVINYNTSNNISDIKECLGTRCKSPIKFIWTNNYVNKIFNDRDEDINIEYAKWNDNSIYAETYSYQDSKMFTLDKIVKNYSKVNEENKKEFFTYKYFDYVSLDSMFYSYYSFGKIETVNTTSDEKTVSTFGIKIDDKNINYFDYENSKKIFRKNKLIYEVNRNFMLLPYNPKTSFLTDFSMYVLSNETIKKYDPQTSILLYTKITNKTNYDSTGNASNILEITKDLHNNETKKSIFSEYKKFNDSPLTKIISKRIEYERNNDKKIQTYLYEYYDNSLLKKEITEPNDEKQKISKTFEYDTTGNIINEKISGVDIQTINTSFIYDKDKIYNTEIIDSLGHKKRVNYNNKEQIKQIINENGVKTVFEYDSFGRKTKEETNNLSRTWNYVNNSNGYIVSEYFNGVHQKTVHFNNFGQIIKEKTKSFDGRDIFIDRQYNNNGLLYKVSNPYYLNQEPKYITIKYDNYDRLISRNYIGKDGLELKSSVRYENLNEIQEDANGNKKIITYDGLGNVIKVKNLLTELSYEYGALGNLTKVINQKFGNILLEYDNWGNKKLIASPTFGAITYDYDSLGNIKKQSNSNGMGIEITYDVLGRIIKKFTNEGFSTSYIYDKEGSLGRIWKESTNGISKEYKYTINGQVKSILTKISDSNNYHQQFIYDNFDRLIEKIEPNGNIIKNSYNDNGYLDSISVTSNDNGLTYNEKEVYKVLEQDHYGRVTSYKLGNGLISNTLYDNNTEHLIQMTSLFENNSPIQDLGFEYDSLDNLISKNDNITNQENIYSYDDLNRLIEKIVNNGASSNSSYTYDETGNILINSNIGEYTYGSINKQAVTNISNNSIYKYDNNGNMIQNKDLNILYNSFGKPTRFQNNNISVTFAYDANNNRYSKQSGDTITYYIDNYEKNIFDNKVNEKSFIIAEGKIIAYINYEDNKNSIKYTIYDNLGSIIAITDDSGMVVEKYSYDDFGNRKTLIQNKNESLSRGYTGHEHIEELNLIHMNGRVYDPIIAKFISPDPEVLDPFEIQDYNRYAYVRNNPFYFTDPSGYNSDDDCEHHPLKCNFLSLGTVTVFSSEMTLGDVMAQSPYLGYGNNGSFGSSGSFGNFSEITNNSKANISLFGNSLFAINTTPTEFNMLLFKPTKNIKFKFGHIVTPNYKFQKTQKTLLINASGGFNTAKGGVSFETKAFKISMNGYLGGIFGSFKYNHNDFGLQNFKLGLGYGYGGSFEYERK